MSKIKFVRIVDSQPKKPHNIRVNKARIASSNKTGLVLKISIALVVLLGLLVYKLNDYFKNDKTYAMQTQIRKGVITTKTSVSAQLAQLKNSISGFENGFSDTNINWVQLDPFFVIANVEATANGQFKVNSLIARSNTPGERWNAGYLEKALLVNKSKEKSPILVQLFKDRANSKYMLIRFVLVDNKEIVVASTADYFQKYFDIERGNRNKSLLITTENILAGHTEADYLATSSKEANLPISKYVIEKEEIVGTNLMAVSYVLKSKIVPPFAIPWPIVGVVIGLGFILIGILYYNLEPIEKRVERYKKQEREQIYKDTVEQGVEGFSTSGIATQNPGEPQARRSVNLMNPNLDDSQVNRSGVSEFVSEMTQTKTLVPPTADRHNIESSDQEDADDFSYSRSPESVEELKPQERELYNLLERATPLNDSSPNKKSEEVLIPQTIKPEVEENNEESFLTLDEEKIDLDEIEKALALDDFDEDKPAFNASAEALEKNLQPQKISVSGRGAPIEKPQFAFDKKDFKVDEVKINIRRPERS